MFPDPCLSLPADPGNNGWIPLPTGVTTSASFSLQFTFQLYGQSLNSLYVANLGLLSFNNVAIYPFDATVDTSNGHGQVWTKSGINTFAVAWDHIGYFPNHNDKLNTFQVLISDGNNAFMGSGNNVCFCYA